MVFFGRPPSRRIKEAKGEVLKLKHKAKTMKEFYTRLENDL